MRTSKAAKQRPKGLHLTEYFKVLMYKISCLTKESNLYASIWTQYLTASVLHTRCFKALFLDRNCTTGFQNVTVIQTGLDCLNKASTLSTVRATIQDKPLTQDFELDSNPKASELMLLQVSSTAFNEGSSRSHTIMRLSIESSERPGPDADPRIHVARTLSFLNLIDLAGSESAKVSGRTPSFSE